MSRDLYILYFFMKHINSLLINNRLTMQRVVNTFFLSLFIITITGCSDFSFFQSPPQEINIVIRSSEQLNPGEKSNSNPLLIKVLELSAINNFKKKDFLSLYHDIHSELGGEIVYLEEIIISPDEIIEIVNTPNSATKYLAFLFSFHNYQNSNHRLWVDISQGVPKKISVNLKNNNATIEYE